eukprot:1144591-Pelagomonas_calceolata.AAC.2
MAAEKRIQTIGQSCLPWQAREGAAVYVEGHTRVAKGLDPAGINEEDKNQWKDVSACTTECFCTHMSKPTGEALAQAGSSRCRRSEKGQIAGCKSTKAHGHSTTASRRQRTNSNAAPAQSKKRIRKKKDVDCSSPQM